MEYQYTPTKEKYGRRVYIGNYQGEELYLKPIKWDCNWYFGGIYLEGLRPTTEDIERKHARDSSLSDYYNIDNIPSKYIDEEAFLDDLEEDWYECADIQEEQERNEETIYLGFGMHTHTDSVLLTDCKGNYNNALKVFDKLLLTEEDFNKLILLLKRFYSSKRKHSQSNKLYLKDMKETEEILKEYEEFIKPFDELPNKDYWIEINDTQ